MRESEVFAQRFALAEHEVRQLQTEGAELNFITVLLPEEPELCPELHSEEVTLALQPRTTPAVFLLRAR